jgi:hypothetical protein
MCSMDKFPEFLLYPFIKSFQNSGRWVVQVISGSVTLKDLQTNRNHLDPGTIQSGY